MYEFKEQKQISDIDIYRFYIGDFKIGVNILSPIRSERNPSFNVFLANDGKYRYKDFGTGDSGSAIDLVMSLFDLTYSAANKKIEFDLNGTSAFLGISRQYIKKEPVNIKIKIRPFSFVDLDYWGQYGITKDILEKFEVFSISNYWLNNELYSVSYKKLCYAYHFNGKFKIYSPHSENHKWYTNCDSFVVQGWNQLKSDGNLIITKSLKDVMCLYSIGYTAISPQSETVVFGQKILNKLTLRFDDVVTLFDNDETGINLADKYEQLGINKIFIPKDSFCKDISDYYKMYGKNKTEEVIISLV